MPGVFIFLTCPLEQMYCLIVEFIKSQNILIDSKDFNLKQSPFIIVLQV